jgi:hypothetical protein
MSWKARGTRLLDGMPDKNVLGCDSIPQPTYKDKELKRAVASDNQILYKDDY